MSFSGWWLESRTEGEGIIVRNSGYFHFLHGGFIRPIFLDYKITKEEDFVPGSIKIVDKELTEWT